MKDFEVIDRVAINFDLDQDVLKKYYKNPQKMYSEITKFMKKNDCSKRQQSSYLSNGKKNLLETLKLVSGLNGNLSHFQESVDKFTVTYENDIFNLMPLVQEDLKFCDFSLSKEKGSLNNDEEKQIAIHFDLGTKEVDKYCSYRSKPYKQVKNVMDKYNFIHQQRSGYISQEKISDLKLFDLVNDLKINVHHFEDIVKCLDATYTDSIWDLTPYIQDDNLFRDLIQSQTDKHKDKGKKYQHKLQVYFKM